MHDLPIEAILAIIALVQVLVHSLVKVVDWAMNRGSHDKIDVLSTRIGRLIERDENRQKMLDEMIDVHRDQDRKVDELYEMHKQKNPDGRPVWWFPPQMLDIAQQQLDELREIANTQKEAALIMKTIVRDLSQIKTGRRTNAATMDD